jgi:hypothetical protein
MNIRKTIHNIFVWSYARGTLQYDIICALILAFVFFVPRSCFVRHNSTVSQATIQKSMISAPNIKAETQP